MDAVTDDVLTVELCGKEYPLVFPIDAIRKAKKKYGSLQKMLDSAREDLDETIPSLVAAGVSDLNITEEWIVANVNFPALFRQQEKIMAAFTGKTKSEFEKDLAEKESEAAAKKAKTQATAS